MTQSKNWFITGAARGLGRELVRTALEHGHQVVATSRDTARIRNLHPGAGERLLVLALDVREEEQTRRAVGAAVDAFGRIDVVVNNAGRGLLSGVEEASDDAVRAIFDINVFGTLNVIRSVLPVLRAQRAGHLINVSSIGGLVGSPGWGIYNSTKFAVEGFTEALSTELAPLGVDVTIIEPGYFCTDFLDASSLHTTPAVIADYEQTAGATRRSAARVEPGQLGNPVKTAAAVVQIAEGTRPPLRLLLGSDSVRRAEEKIGQLLRDIDRYRDLSLSADDRVRNR